MPAGGDGPPARCGRLGEAVVAAAAAGSNVSVAGSGHSFTEAALTDGTMLDVGLLTGVSITTRPRPGQGRGGSSSPTSDAELDRLGLAMENLGDIDRQTIAGSISTGTHGTGDKLRNLSSQVEALELVAGDGGLHELTAPTPTCCGPPGSASAPSARSPR